MLGFIVALLAVVGVFFRSRHDTAIEILALRQQVAVLKRKRPRPKLNTLDRLFWTTLRRMWSRWAGVLIIVKPETFSGDPRAWSANTLSENLFLRKQLARFQERKVRPRGADDSTR